MSLFPGYQIFCSGPPIICPAPPTLPELPISPSNSRNSSAAERQAARAKSSRNQIKFTACFKNCTKSAVDLIWKNYDGEEELIRQNFQPGDTYSACTYLTHPYIAKDSATQNLRSFLYDSTTSVVFEGLNFGVPQCAVVTVSICEMDLKQEEPGW